MIHAPTKEHVEYRYINPISRSGIKWNFMFNEEDYLLPFWRGGIHLALSLNGILGCPILNVYNPHKKEFNLDPKNHESPVWTEKVIIVEDIVDTGETVVQAIDYFQQLKNMFTFPQFEVACIVAKPRGIRRCRDIGIDVMRMCTIPDNTWAVFPWEKDPMA